jgi:hypothetical protein
MAKTLEFERNMTNIDAPYCTTGDSLWRLIQYFASVRIVSHLVGYVKNIDIIFHYILGQFKWYDKIGCIRVKYAII